jgi:hypothetical protein
MDQLQEFMQEEVVEDLTLLTQLVQEELVVEEQEQLELEIQLEHQVQPTQEVEVEVGQVQQEMVEPAVQELLS